MILCLDQVLSPDNLKTIHTLLKKGEFVDGKLTAGTFAKAVKYNEQLQGKTDIAQTVETMICQAIQSHPLFQSIAQPKAIRPCLINRYSAGMSYGWHTDNAMMGQAGQLNRSDLSFTLFLSDPDTYTGGELVLDTDGGDRSIKLAAGAMVLYPSTFLHRVAEVTKGERLAAVSWVQSIIRDASKRTVLFELDTVRRSLFEKYGKTDEFDLLCKTYANLLRQWAEV